MYPMSTSCCRFVDLGFIFVYWTLNLSLSSSRYCTLPAPGRHGADHSRSVSVSYYPYRNRIVGGQAAPQRRTYSDLSQQNNCKSQITTCQISLSRTVLPRLPAPTTPMEGPAVQPCWPFRPEAGHSRPAAKPQDFFWVTQGPPG